MSRMNFVFVVALAITAILAGMVSVAPAEIYAPSFADANSVYKGHQSTDLGVDLDPTVTELVNTSDPDVMKWTHAPSDSAWGMYQANNTTSPTIWVCVPDPVSVSRVILWNGHQDNAAGDCRNRCVQNFNLYTSTGRDNSGFTLQYTGTLTHPTNGANVVAEAANFSSPVTGHYIRIGVLNTYGGAYTVLSEVRFDAVKLASNIVTPVSASAYSYLNGGWRGSALPKRVIDGGFMNEPGVDLTQWTLEATAHALYAPSSTTMDDTASAWVSTSGTIASQWVQFDLGSPKNLGKIHLWNLNVANNTGLGVKDLQVWSCDVAGNVIANLSGAITLPQATGTTAYSDQAFALSGATGVQYVKLLVSSNWNGAITGQVGLSEVRFEGVPEPGTLALLAAGLAALLAYAWRKRK